MPADRRGLTIVVAEAAPGRFRSALVLALAQAALGGRSRIFLDSAAVALLRPPIAAPDDAACRDAGLPTLAALVADALDAGVALILCQTGLTLARIRADDQDARIEAGGMVSLLQTLGEDRLVVA